MYSDVVTAPYWWEAAAPQDAPPADWPVTADVVIIGGGFTGFGAALPLARAGMQVVVLEKLEVPLNG